MTATPSRTVTILVRLDLVMPSEPGVYLPPLRNVSIECLESGRKEKVDAYAEWDQNEGWKTLEDLGPLEGDGPDDEAGEWREHRPSGRDEFPEAP